MALPAPGALQNAGPSNYLLHILELSGRILVWSYHIGFIGERT